MQTAFHLRVVSTLGVAAMISACEGSDPATAGTTLGEEGDRDQVSLVRGIRHPGSRPNRRPDSQSRGPDFRSIDGRGNNSRDDDLGAAHTRLARWARPDYAGRPWLLWSANGQYVSEASETPIEWVVVQR